MILGAAPSDEPYPVTNHTTVENSTWLGFELTSFGLLLIKAQFSLLNDGF